MSDDEILNYLQRIETRLANIENILKHQETSVKKMSDHIDFVDMVYDNVKKPFCRILSAYNGSNVKLDKKMISDK